jgi:hypothetical protein
MIVIPAAGNRPGTQNSAYGLLRPPIQGLLSSLSLLGLLSWSGDLPDRGKKSGK